MKKLKNFVDLIYYCYYKFQIKVGNDVEADYMALLFFLYVSMYYYIAIVLIKTIILGTEYSFKIVMLLLVLQGFYLAKNYLYKDRYKLIPDFIKKKCHQTKYKILVILFTFLGFILTFLPMFILYLHNIR